MNKLFGCALVLATTGCVNYGSESSASEGETEDEKKKAKQVWVTHQTPDSRLTTLAFPSGEVQGSMVLPTGTMPHLATWGNGQYVYVSGMGNGTVNVVHADTQTLVATFQLAPQLVHQVRLSPDRSNALVTVLPTRTLHKMNIDEGAGAFSMAGQSLTFAQAPICSVYRADGQRAYVSLLPQGLAVVDVPTMTLLNIIPTDGFIACGMIKASETADHAIIASSGASCINTANGTNCGRIYTLDMNTDTLIDRGSVGATVSWHSWNNSEDETVGFGTSPFDDKVVMVDLTTTPVTVVGTLTLDAGPGPDEPDAVGAGTPIRDGTLAVSLRASGHVALIDVQDMTVKTFNMLAAASTGHHPVLCNGCSLHGISNRP